jgi:hypothetical protein
MTTSQRKAMTRGSLWMTLISLGLCLVPVVGGLIAGLVGGYRIGNMGRSLLGATIAGVVSGVLSWLLLSLALPHMISVSAGVAIAAWVLVSEAGLISGAAIGAISHPIEA